MKSISGKRLIKILEAKGWILKRIQGSHYIYSNENSIARISIPVHGNKDLKMGLLNHLMKIADINEDEL